MPENTLLCVRSYVVTPVVGNSRPTGSSFSTHTYLPLCVTEDLVA